MPTDEPCTTTTEHKEMLSFWRGCVGHHLYRSSLQQQPLLNSTKDLLGSSKRPLDRIYSFERKLWLEGYCFFVRPPTQASIPHKSGFAIIVYSFSGRRKSCLTVLSDLRRTANLCLVSTHVRNTVPAASSEGSVRTLRRNRSSAPRGYG